MSKAPNYYIVDAEALPEIFHKVVQARRMLDTGEAETVNQAVQLVGISRSAFYKYKDAVRPFQDMLHGRIVTFQMMPHHQPGPAHQRLRRGHGERRDLRLAGVLAGPADQAQQRGRRAAQRGAGGVMSFPKTKRIQI